MPEFTLNVNGRDVVAKVDDPAMPLLYFLRNDLGLRGPRFGCGLGQCGACTVHINGLEARSCIYPIAAVKGKVLTLEGLGDPENLHPMQRAFIDEQAVQCGYCINGMIMEAVALLKRTPKPSEDEIREVLSAHLCRCGTHLRIVRAVLRASNA
jgi:nicotinate dehydrogenase subunit A